MELYLPPQGLRDVLATVATDLLTLPRACCSHAGAAMLTIWHAGRCRPGVAFHLISKCNHDDCCEGQQAPDGARRVAFDGSPDYLVMPPEKIALMARSLPAHARLVRLAAASGGFALIAAHGVFPQTVAFR